MPQTVEERKIKKAEYLHKYRIINKEKLNKQSRLYRLNNLETCHTVERKWRDTHQETIQIWKNSNSEKLANRNKKHQLKRRNLGFITLNKPFLGCEGHHMDKEHVVHVPQALHQSIPHNVWTGLNMVKINTMVYVWLTGR